MTEDAGDTWRDISGTLPDVPSRSITRHPKNPQWLYAGTEVGLYTSEDGGKTWSTKNDGPGTVSIEELVWVGSDTLLEVTHGREIFQAKVTGGAAAAKKVSAPYKNQKLQPRSSNAQRTLPQKKIRTSPCSVNDIIRGAARC